MGPPYLMPEDVSDANTLMVLDFLNRATTPLEIAQAVEFSNELDVGIRVAERILRRRDQLGGFSSLEQLYAVPYVGPERFTEIVVSLSAQRLPVTPTAGTSSDVLAELQLLRRSFDALQKSLGPQPQIRIWSVQETIWLGQCANLLVQVTDAAGKPLIDQAVTLATHWGELELLNGLPQRGPSVALRTDELGLAQVRLFPRFQASLSEAQRLALERVAVRLPLNAPSPIAARAELVELVELYRAPASFELRESIDSLYREYAASLEASEHRGQTLSQWNLIPVTLVGFLQEEPSARGARTLATASHTLLVRNWLGAFISTFERASGSDGQLEKELQRTSVQEDAGAYVNQALITVQAFVNTERGELGKAIRHRSAELELQRFLQGQVAKLPSSIQVDVLGGLQTASKTIGEGGLTLFNAVETVRKGKGLGLNANLDAVLGRIDSLEATSVRTKDLQRFRTEFQSRADAQFAAFQTSVNQQLELKADRSAVTDLGLRVDQTTVRVNQLDVRTNSLDQSVTTLNGNVGVLNSRVDRNLATLGSRLDGIDLQLRR